MKKKASFATVLVLTGLGCMNLRGEQLSIKLVGSAQPSCWSLEDIVAGVIDEEMSDREKVVALHQFGMAHILHYDGPTEDRRSYVYDAMKILGVYGHSLCGNNSATMSALYETAGLRTRLRNLNGHVVPEVWFEGRWHCVDTDLYGYVYLPDRATLASVDDLLSDPGLFDRQEAPPKPYFPFDTMESMKSLFRNTEGLKNYHPYANAHLMNLSLRTREALTLYYRPRQRFFLAPDLPREFSTVYRDYWTLGPVRKDSLAWCEVSPAAYGNGVFVYEPDLRSRAFQLENPAIRGARVQQQNKLPALIADQKVQPASVVLEMASPWVIAGMQNDLTNFDDNSQGAIITGRFWRMDETDENRIFVSTDAGQTWKQVWKNPHRSAVPFHVDLTRWVEGRHQYWVKFEWVDANGSERVGLETLRVDTWVQLSPMALPRLGSGRNQFSLVTRPARAFYCESRWDNGEQLLAQRLENLTLTHRAPFVRPKESGSAGSIFFRLAPAGVLEEVRISLLARVLEGVSARGTAATLFLSEDQGKTWQELKHFTPDPEHQLNVMWFNYRLQGKNLNAEQALLKVTLSGVGLDKLVANSLMRSAPQHPSLLRISHVWKEGQQVQSAVRTLSPGVGAHTYEISTGPQVVNEELHIEALEVLRSPP